jgi:hypothetical protein
MSSDHKTIREKQAIAKRTVEKFLCLYNGLFGCNFMVEELDESPDVTCKDSNTGEKLALEVACLEDVRGDTGYVLGRLAKPETKSGLPARRFSFDTLPQLINQIMKTSRKDYDSNVALIIMQISGIPWDLENELDEIQSKVVLRNNPFNKGIWILSIEGDIFRIDK